MAPLPHGRQIHTPINSAFGATIGRAAKRMGGFGYARGIFHEETMSEHLVLTGPPEHLAGRPPPVRTSSLADQ
eukprot:scaffold107136_cov64-Phaeocystis_antarctica.AAC.1